jgi:hypothetical protein
MTLSRLASTLCFGAVAALASLPAAAADSGSTGSADDHFCIPTQNIRETRAIDAKTILVRMTPGNEYRKITLVNNCSGLTTQGFSYETSINKLCRSDALRVVEPVGATCMIERIDTISEAEAKALQDKKKRG